MRKGVWRRRASGKSGRSHCAKVGEGRREGGREVGLGFVSDHSARDASWNILLLLLAWLLLLVAPFPGYDL